MILPTSWGGYVAPSAISRIAYAAGREHCSRTWSFAGRDRSVMVGKRLFKGDFCFPGNMVPQFLDELEAAGYKDPRPSSWAWPFHQRVRTHGSKASELAILDQRYAKAQFPRAWQEALPGKTLAERKDLRGQLVPGQWTLYDIRSAYAWAASRPLPDTAFAVHVTRASRSPGRYCIYLIDSPQFSARSIPPRFRTRHAHSTGALQWVTDEEMEELDIQSPEVVYGLEFPKQLDLRPALDNIREQLPTFYKNVYRAFWGAWLGKTGPTETILKRGSAPSRREMPAFNYNPILAAWIMARVSLRIAPVAALAAHVQVDSVLVPVPISTGPEIGDWREVAKYDSIFVEGTGRWGDASGLVKHAGTGLPNEIVRAVDMAGIRMGGGSHAP